MKNQTFNLLKFVLFCAGALHLASASRNTPATPSAAGAQSSSTASPQGHHSSFRVAPGSVFHVVLTKNVDAKNDKIGDQVTTAILEDLKSNGEVMIQKGSKVIGRITQIQARSKEHPQSQIAIVFDRLVLNDGTEVVLSASIQALAAAETAPADENEQANTGYGGAQASGGRGGSPGGGGRNPSGAGASNESAARTAAQGSGSPSRGLSAASQGVFGLKGISLNTESDASHSSFISSDHRNVHLEHGTQMVLRVIEE